MAGMSAPQVPRSSVAQIAKMLGVDPKHAGKGLTSTSV
jgi:hypothetical protein